MSFLIYSIILFFFIKEINCSTCKEESYVANEDNVKLIGRYHIDSSITWLVQSGSSIEFNLIAKTSNIVLAGDKSIESDITARPRYAIYVEDQLVLDTLMSEKEKTVNLLNGGEEKKVKIRVMLLTEGFYGGVGIKSINIYSCSKETKLISPTPRKELSIEFIGDSLTCAYSVETNYYDAPLSTDTENFSYSFAYLVAQYLDADYSAVCSSGTGFIFCWDNNGILDNYIDRFYNKTSKLEPYYVDWNFEKHQHDIIFINLGTNDYFAVQDLEKEEDKKAKLEEFKEAYINFLMLVREKYPSAYIISGFGMTHVPLVYSYIEAASKEFADKGDKKVFCFQLEEQDIEKDGQARYGHPTIITHKKQAIYIADKIREILKDN
jgi:hypothetical protein